MSTKHSLAQLFVKIPLHPLYALVIALMVGIGIGSSTSKNYLFGFIIAMAVVFVAVNAKPYRHTLFALALCGFLSLGALRVQQKTAGFDQFFRATTYGACICTARVLDIENDYKNADSLTITLRIEELTKKQKVIPHVTGFCFRLSLKNKNLILKEAPYIPEIGDTVTIDPLYFRAPPDNEYKNYLLKEGIVGHINFSKAIIHTIKRPYISIRRFVFQLRNGVIERIRPSLTPLTFTMFASIFLGKKAVNSKDINHIRNQFKPWGILHHLARAGLHMMILVMVLQKLLGFLPLPFAIRTSLTLLIILLYALLSWASIPFVRAAFLSTFYSLCALLKLQTNGIYLLFLIACIILINNPFHLFALDFQLSFLITFVFSWLNALKASSRNTVSNP